MAICDTTSRPIVLEGSIESLDPYGYVPADQFVDLPFYFSLSTVYVIVGSAWLVLCVAYRDQLMPLQLWISSVMAVSISILFLLTII